MTLTESGQCHHGLLVMIVHMCRNMYLGLVDKVYY